MKLSVIATTFLVLIWRLISFLIRYVVLLCLCPFLILEQGFSVKVIPDPLARVLCRIVAPLEYL